MRYSGNLMDRLFEKENLISEEEAQMANKNMKRHVYGCQAHSKLTPYHTEDWQEREFHVGQGFGDRHSAESIHCVVISECGE